MISQLEKKPLNEPKETEMESPKIESHILPEVVILPNPQHIHRPLNDIPLFMIQPPRSDVELKQLLLVLTPQVAKNEENPVVQEEKEEKDIPKKQQVLTVDTSSDEWLPPSPESPHFHSGRRNRFCHQSRHTSDHKIEDYFSYLSFLDYERAG